MFRSAAAVTTMAWINALCGLGRSLCIGCSGQSGMDHRGAPRRLQGRRHGEPSATIPDRFDTRRIHRGQEPGKVVAAKAGLFFIGDRPGVYGITCPPEGLL